MTKINENAKKQGKRKNEKKCKKLAKMQKITKNSYDNQNC